jgi:hypothetical protein
MPQGTPVSIVSSDGFSSVASFTRPNDTTAYTAGDVEGGALEFDGIGPSTGGQVVITTAKLEQDVSSIPSGETSFRLYLYNVTPPSALADNAAWDLPSGDRASFAGYVDLGTPVDLGSTCYVETSGINKQVTVPAGGKLFGYLVTNGGYTPSALSVKKITLHAVAV